MEKKITLPLTEELAKTLKAGDSVYVTGTIYTSRDAGHKRMCEALERIYLEVNGERLARERKEELDKAVAEAVAKAAKETGVARI